MSLLLHVSPLVLALLLYLSRLFSIIPEYYKELPTTKLPSSTEGMQRLYHVIIIIVVVITVIIIIIVYTDVISGFPIFIAGYTKILSTSQVSTSAERDQWLYQILVLIIVFLISFILLVGSFCFIVFFCKKSLMCQCSHHLLIVKYVNTVNGNQPIEETEPLVERKVQQPNQPAPDPSQVIGQPAPDPSQVIGQPAPDRSEEDEQVEPFPVQESTPSVHFPVQETLFQSNQAHSDQI